MARIDFLQAVGAHHHELIVSKVVFGVGVEPRLAEVIGYGVSFSRELKDVDLCTVKTALKYR